MRQARGCRGVALGRWTRVVSVFVVDPTHGRNSTGLRGQRCRQLRASFQFQVTASSSGLMIIRLVSTAICVVNT